MNDGMLDMADVRVWADVHMRDLGDAPQILRAGVGTNVHFNGAFYPGRVLECEPQIASGQSGKALIGVLSAPESFQEGVAFELRDGPRRAIADATIISLIANVALAAG